MKLFTICTLGVIILVSLCDAIFAPPPTNNDHFLTTQSDLFIGGINAEVQRRALRQSTGAVPFSGYTDLKVVNVGSSPLLVQATYGTGETYHGYIHSATIQPGETTTLKCDGTYYMTALTIYNKKGNRRGIFYSWRGPKTVGLVSDSKPNDTVTSNLVFDRDVVEVVVLFVSLEVVSRIAGNIPGASFAVSILTDIFFPPKAETDPWEGYKVKIEKMIKESRVVVIEAILENDISPLQERIEDVQESIKSKDIRRLYLNLADYMVGLESKCIFKKGEDALDANYAVLPIFSRIINMKMSYYSWGLTYAKDLDLDDSDTRRLKKYREKTVKKAGPHMDKLMKDRTNWIYNTNDPDFLYDRLATARSYIAVNGQEYLPEWEHMVDPEETPKNANTFMVYSGFFGRSSPKLWLQAWLEFGKPPLTPTLVSKTERTKLESIKLYQCNGQQLCGIKLTFHNKEHYLLGSSTLQEKEVQLNGAMINKMEVSGDGKLDTITFYLSDNRELKYGSGPEKKKKTFELKDHHIASMFAANDLQGLNKQLGNIAVSYTLNSLVGNEKEIPKKYQEN